MSRWARFTLIWTCLLTYSHLAYLGAVKRGLLPRSKWAFSLTAEFMGFLVWAAGLWLWTCVERRRNRE